MSNTETIGGVISKQEAEINAFGFNNSPAISEEEYQNKIMWLEKDLADVRERVVQLKKRCLQLETMLGIALKTIKQQPL